jgi:hypothetical protein
MVGVMEQQFVTDFLPQREQIVREDGRIPLVQNDHIKISKALLEEVSVDACATVVNLDAKVTVFCHELVERAFSASFRTKISD